MGTILTYLGHEFKPIPPYNATPTETKEYVYGYFGDFEFVKNMNKDIYETYLLIGFGLFDMVLGLMFWVAPRMALKWYYGYPLDLET